MQLTSKQTLCLNCFLLAAAALFFMCLLKKKLFILIDALQIGESHKKEKQFDFKCPIRQHDQYDEI